MIQPLFRMQRHKRSPLSLPGGLRAINHGSGKTSSNTGKTSSRVKLGCHLNLNIGTYNIRTMNSEARLQELQEELQNINWDIVGLCEIRRKGENLYKLEDGHWLYYKGTKDGRCGGVGLLINKRLINQVVKVENISERIISCVLQLNKRYTLQIVQVYAPTSSHSDEEIEELYDDLTSLCNKENHHYRIVMGDFNGKIGKYQDGEKATGKYGVGARNERGNRLIDFAEGQGLHVMNTFFNKKENRKWTWVSPKGNKSEIDFILSNNKSIFKDCTVLNKFNVGSDHRLVRAKIEINCKVERRKLIKENKKKVDINHLYNNREAFEIEISNKFKLLENLEEDLSTQNNNIVNTIIETARKVAPNTNKGTESKISRETQNMMKKRREMKRDNNRDKIEYVELCKTIRKRIKEETRQFNVKLVQNLIEENKGIKLAKKKLSTKKKLISALKRDDGYVVKNKRQILDTVQEFYTALYEDDGKETYKEEITEEIPNIMVEEVEATIRSMKKGKSPGEDQISIEMLKAGGEPVFKQLTKLFQRCLLEKNVPSKWKEAEVILLHKKGDQMDLRNYRPISLLPVIYKIFTKVLERRMTRILDAAQPVEQAGFRSGFSTMDHIQTVQQIIEKHNEYKMPLCMAFIDYEKAFDSIKTGAIIDALANQGVDKAYIQILQSIYEDATASIKVNDDKVQINIRKGVRQGDTISPKLFSAGLEEIFRKLDWEKKGVKINGNYLTHLRFADDIILFCNNADELQENIKELNLESKKVGLKMNKCKTKIMYNKFAQRRDVLLDDGKLEEVENYIYLGKHISMDGGTYQEVERRTKLGWRAFGRLNIIFKNNLPICLKRKVFNECILPVITYGSETWTTNTRILQKLRTTQRSMERQILGITRRDKKRCTWIREQTGVCDVIQRIKSLKWRWAGHIARRNDARWTKQTMEWIPRDHRRSKGRPEARWMDDLAKYLGSGWQREAQDRRNWKNKEEAFILQWIENG